MVEETEGRTKQGTHPPPARSPRPGKPGDVRPIGKGLSELQFDVGPGYRIYYAQDGDALILLLCGGDKSTQQKDIDLAHELAERWRHERTKEGNQ